MNRLKRSFSARLSFFILGVSALIFVGAYAAFFRSSSRMLERDARVQAENTLEIINLKIENVLRRVESVPDNLKWVISNGGIPADSVWGITRRVIADNPDIYGSTVAFEPSYFPAKGHYYAPYSYRDEDGVIRSLQLGTDEYDYFNWDWYRIPKELGHACWSPPYYDEGGGQMMMCTYSAPIYDRRGDFMAIFTADISLEWLTDLINGMKRSDDSYTFMLAQDGTYIVHYDMAKILDRTIFSVADEMNAPNVRRLGEEMIAGNRGMIFFDNRGVHSYAFFAPVPHTQWSLGIVIPQAEVLADLRRSNITLSLIFIVGLAALFLACWRIVSHLARPLKKFAVSARTIARGDFHAQLPRITSHDEMKELADSFGYMQTELTSYIANLQDTTSAKEKIESELRIARDIQMGMIPKSFPPFPSRREIDLYATLNPAKEVGGDLYDFFLEESKLYFAIGDVSGKGVPASLFMAVTRSLFRSVAAMNDSPSTIVSLLNGSISENNDSNMFVTLLVGILDLESGLLRYCNAGHNPPVVISPEGECAFMKVLPNIPVGVAEEFPYKDQQMQIADGSTLVLYTDGVTEAESTEKELYGENRLMEVLQANTAASPRTLVEGVITGIDAHVKENTPSDDITLLVIRYDKTPHVVRESLVIRNDLVELARVSAFIEGIGERLSLSPALVMNLNLVLEEAITNTILYGYKDQENKEIEISARKDGDVLAMTITDSGTKFDPTQKTDPDITLAAEDRPIGGLGIYLIKNIMNEVEYQRVNGKNVFTMKKVIQNQ